MNTSAHPLGSNTPQAWDAIWDLWFRKLLPYRVVEQLGRNRYYFRGIRKLLGDINLRGGKILELGSGTGTNSLNIAAAYRCAQVTLVDFSARALKEVPRAPYPFSLNLLQEDIFRFSVLERYDLVHSMGLVEHFTGQERLEAVARHAYFARPGGFVMLWAPQRSAAFGIIGAVNKIIGHVEDPLAEGELARLARSTGLLLLREDTMIAGALAGVLAQKPED